MKLHIGLICKCCSIRYPDEDIGMSKHVDQYVLYLQEDMDYSIIYQGINNK